MRLVERPLFRIVLLLAVALTPVLLTYFLFTSKSPSVRAVAFAPDGSALATVSSTIGDARFSQELRIYDLKGGLERRLARRRFPMRILAIGPDGRSISAQTATGRISTADLSRWPYALLCDGTPWSGSALFSPDGRTLATLAGSEGEPYSGQGPVQLWDSATGRLRETLGSDRAIAALGFSPDGRTLAAATLARDVFWERLIESSLDARTLAEFEARLVVWDLESRRESLLPTPAAATVYPFAIAPGGAVVAAKSVDGLLTVWGLTEDQAPRTVPGLVVDALAFSPDGRRLAVAGDEAVEVWELATMRKLTRFRGHTPSWWTRVRSRAADLLGGTSGGLVTNTIWSVAFSPDGRSVASADSRGAVCVWEAASGRERSRFAHRYEILDSAESQLYAVSWLWASICACAGWKWVRKRAKPAGPSPGRS